MLAAILVLLYVPLKEGLVQVRREAVARAAVNESLRRIADGDNIVNQQVNVGNGVDPIRASLVVTGPVAPGRISDAERSIVRRTGREAHIAVRQVADQAELARLRAGLQTVAPPPPAVRTLDEIRSDVVERLSSAIRATWPEGLPPLTEYDIALAPEGITVHVQYESDHPLPAVAQLILTRSLEHHLAVRPVRLVAENVPPPAPARPSRRTRNGRSGAAAR
jgi:hypothetical protein